ncbi:hypothetical protein [Trinickia acidisoli]|uniref:hypothetical protein n=1 Tax=Trinickia acidisoli TaxID=2767482 RepID=UPI001A8C925C|nr:hypothetical protein [Trinickia acidisoli]
MKVSIVTPMYGGACMANYCVAMVDLARTLTQHGIAFDFFTLSNESLIQRARNVLVHRARSDAEATHFLLVDADIGFQVHDVLELLNLDVDIVCGAYSRKDIQWENVRRAALAGASPLEEYASSTFVEGLDGPLDAKVMRDQRLIEVRRAGTGFMLIKKEVLDLLEASPFIRRYRNNMTILREALAVHEDCITAFFDCPIDPIEGTLLSEDYYFCDAWRRFGGKIFVAPWVKLTHFGTYCYV